MSTKKAEYVYQVGADDTLLMEKVLYQDGNMVLLEGDIELSEAGSEGEDFLYFSVEEAISQAFEHTNTWLKNLEEEMLRAEIAFNERKALHPKTLEEYRALVMSKVVTNEAG